MVGSTNQLPSHGHPRWAAAFILAAQPRWLRTGKDGKSNLKEADTTGRTRFGKKKKQKTSILLFAGLGGERGNEIREAAVRGCRGVCRRGAVCGARPHAARKAIYSPFPCGFPKLLPGYCQDYSELQIWTQMWINFSQSCS